MKFKKTINILTILLFSVQILSAQNEIPAEKIIADLLIDAKTNAIKTNFKLTTNDKNSPQSITGTFIIKGTKFVLEMDEMKVWFDGKTQWSYLSQNNEVSVTEPSEKELSETNPMAILSGFKSKSVVRFSPKIKSVQNYCIEMTPKTKSQEISKIEVQVNKTNSQIVTIKLINKNGTFSLLTLSNFQKGVKVNDNSFAFIPGKYKGAVINDLR